MFSKISAFLQESKQEFKRVNWPSFSEVTRMTMIVIVFSLSTALFLGLLDALFTFGLSKFI